MLTYNQCLERGTLVRSTAQFMVMILLIHAISTFEFLALSSVPF